LRAGGEKRGRVVKSRGYVQVLDFIEGFYPASGFGNKINRLWAF